MSKNSQQNYRTPQPKQTKLPEGSNKQGGESGIKHHEANAVQNDTRENNKPSVGEGRPNAPDLTGPM